VDTLVLREKECFKKACQKQNTKGRAT